MNRNCFFFFFHMLCFQYCGRTNQISLIVTEAETEASTCFVFFPLKTWCGSGYCISVQHVRNSSYKVKMLSPSEGARAGIIYTHTKIGLNFKKLFSAFYIIKDHTLCLDNQKNYFLNYLNKIL